jgi:hypothetical protein
MQIPFENKTLISKLRVKGFGVDSLAARLSFEKMFSENDFLPKGLPAKAIICIKHLRDPKPQTLQLQGFNLGNSSRIWQHSVSAEIERLYRRAVRPIRETVPTNTECIVFADDAELLACLAKDWIRGNLNECWWWKSLFPGFSLPENLFGIWLEKAESVPFALQMAAKQNCAADFVRRLKPLEIKAVLQKIINVYGLIYVRNNLQTSRFTEQKLPVSDTGKLSETQSSSVKNFEKNKTFDKVPEWLKIVPETINQTLNFDQKCLLGISLMIVRSPRIVRTREFATQIKVWQNKPETQIQTTPKVSGNTRIILPPTNTQKTAENSAVSETARNITGNHSKKSFELKDLPLKKSGSKVAEVEKLRARETAKTISPANPKTAELTRNLQTSDKSARPKTGFNDDKFSVKVKKQWQKPAPKPSAKTGFEADFAQENEFEFSIVTLYGGIFFLLNVALHLHLYRDFTESGETEIELNIWDFAALAAEHFLGEKVKNDAVWQLLQKLSGRETDQKISSKMFKKDWRIPAGWLKTFQTNKPFVWTTNRKNLPVYHPAGFCIIDCLKKPDLETQLKDELKVYGINFSEVVKSDSGESQKSATWFQHLFEFMQVRLIQALNLEKQSQINEILFKRTAQITVSATHLDVYFRLADLPIEVRMSGVDRNPGWIPAAGKFVNFHFV